MRTFSEGTVPAAWPLLGLLACSSLLRLRMQIGQKYPQEVTGLQEGLWDGRRVSVFTSGSGQLGKPRLVTVVEARHENLCQGFW